MDKDEGLPLGVGQFCEARSFQHGYRGAWFRCKIKQISRRKGFMYHLLEYIDFPDEKESWTKLYQMSSSRKKERQLMVRPQYPPIYLEGQMPLVNSISEVIVVVSATWNVGDLVDWLKDDCYWSGKITQILGDGKAEIELPLPPLGEGSSYEVSFQDLRPSLDWSPRDGWRVPTSVEGGKSHQCAHLVYPTNQAGGGSSGFQMPFVGRTSDGYAADQLPSAPTPRPVKSIAAPDKTSGTSLMQEKPSSLTGKAGRSVNLVPDSSYPSKKLRASGGNPLKSSRWDTLEAAVLGLEELGNKIKWLKGLLSGRSSSSNTLQHSWRFIEHHGPSMPK